MAGLMQQEPQEPQGAPQPQGVAPEVGYEGEAPVDGEAPNVSPEEQEQYDKFVDNGMQIIFGDGFDKVLERITASGNPVEGLANITFMVISRLLDSARQKGAKLSGDVLYHGGIELMEQIADAAEQTGVYTFSEDELEQALYATLDLFGQMKMDRGEVDSEMYQQEMAQLIEADKNGQLEQEFPELKEKFSG